MNIPPVESIEEVVVPTVGKGVDRGRRKIGAAGVAGTGVILSLASRSAMGGWGQCTGSELASGNLSRTGTPNACGCSPGYWWNINGQATWDKYLLAYPRLTSKFNVIFGRTYFNPDVLMWNCGPNTNNPRAHLPSANGLDNVAMHAVAALLNAAFYGTRYPVPGLQTPGAVIAAFQTAVDANTPQALKDFVARVDIYTSARTWCDGTQH